MFVELIFFRAKPNIPDSTVIEKAQVIQTLAAQIGATFELEILKTDEGEWVEIAHWDNQEEAHRVEQTVLNMPEAQQAMSVMDEASIRMVFLHPAAN